MLKIINIFLIVLFATKINLSQDILIKDCSGNKSSARAEENLQCDEWQIEISDGGLISRKSMEACIRDMESRKKFNKAWYKFIEKTEVVEEYSAPICKKCNNSGLNDMGKLNSDRLTYAKMIYDKAMDKIVPKLEDLKALMIENPFIDIGSVVMEYKDNLIDASNKLQELRDKFGVIENAYQESVLDEISKMQSELQVAQVNLDKTFLNLPEEYKYALNNKEFVLRDFKAEEEAKRLADEKRKIEEERLAEEKRLSEDRRLMEEKKLANEKQEVMIYKDEDKNNFSEKKYVYTFVMIDANKNTNGCVKFITPIVKYELKDLETTISQLANIFQKKINEIMPLDSYYLYYPHACELCENLTNYRGTGFDIIKQKVCDFLSCYYYDTKEKCKAELEGYINGKTTICSPFYTIELPTSLSSN